MTQFLAAFTVFVALHSIPASPRIRGNLVSRLGHGTYIALYSAVSVFALAWLFYAALNLDYIELWAPASWQGNVAFVAAPLGLFFVLAGLFSRNPFSTTARRDGGDPGAVVSVTRHPVLWGFVFWALGHIPPNGDLRSLLLFGGFALFSLGSMAMMEKRSRKKLDPALGKIAAGTSIIPFSSILQKRARLWFDTPMLLAFLGTAVLVAWLLAGGHAWLFGGDPLHFMRSF